MPRDYERIKILAKRDDSLWATMRASGGEVAPPVIRHQAEALLESWGFAPGVKREWYEDNFSDKMLEKYGDDWSLCPK